MALRNCQAVRITPQIYITSLKNTVTWAKKRPNPMQNIYCNIMGMIIKKIRHVKGTQEKIINMNRAPMENRKFTNSLLTEARVKIYFGTYIFFKRLALLITEVRDRVVETIVKENRSCPVRMYIAKLSTFLEKRLEKTINKTSMVRSGFSMLQK